MSIEKRKKIIAKRYKQWPVVGVQEKLDELLKKEQTLSKHVKKFSFRS